MLYKAAFSLGKESGGYRGKNVLKNNFLAALSCLASDLVSPSHWGGTNDSTEGQKGDYGLTLPVRRQSFRSYSCCYHGYSLWILISKFAQILNSVLDQESFKKIFKRGSVC